MEWISVKDRLPEADKTVLVYEDDDMCFAYYSKMYKCWVSYGIACEPTHWMPLSEPPKEDA